jgi:ABC-type glycerol-3-phosphate transport system substrate-binding protein
LGEIRTFYGWLGPIRDNFENVAAYASAVGADVRVRFDDTPTSAMEAKMDGPWFPEKFSTNDLAHLLDGSAPPQWNRVGAHGQPWLYELTDLAREQQWDETYPAEILDWLREDQQLYGVPLTTVPHNFIAYSEAFFEAHAKAFPPGVFPPRSWEDFQRVLEIIKTDPEIQKANSGHGVVPLALAEWLWWHWVWDAVVPASAGVEFHGKFWSLGFEAPLPDAPWAADEPLSEAFRRVAWLYCGDAAPDECRAAQCPLDPPEARAECLGTGPGYVNQDAMMSYAELDAEELVARLVEGRVALLPMAWGTVDELGAAARRGIRLGVFPLPGAAGDDELAVITLTSLVHSRSSPNPEGARAFLRTLMSEAGQLTFQGGSGTTLRRVNLGDPRLTPFGRTTAKYLRNAVDSGNIVLGGLNTRTYQECGRCPWLRATPLVLWQSASADALLANAREFYTTLKTRPPSE